VNSPPVWVFGYGSLIWRPGFPFEERRAAFVDGFVRRLDQGSPDHRGTPERLGRVATLVASPGQRCGGVVYRLSHETAAATLAALDVREQGGYERLDLTAHVQGGGAVPAITWVATAENPYHLGEASLDAMVAEIRGAVGPSGANVEYVLALDRALRELDIVDAHVAALAAALRSAAAP
jgi:cation transport regulator ChaC